MASYKLNQVEEAIAATLGRSDDEDTSELRVRIKRLLDTDRALGRDLRATDPERAAYAFYSSDAPGSGLEVCSQAMKRLRFLRHCSCCSTAGRKALWFASCGRPGRRLNPSINASSARIPRNCSTRRRCSGEQPQA